MHVAVKLFARAKQLVGSDSINLELPDDATIKTLKSAVIAAHPELETLLPHVRFAINTDYANDDSPIPPAAEIACIPPVSGG